MTFSYLYTEEDCETSVSNNKYFYTGLVSLNIPENNTKDFVIFVTMCENIQFPEFTEFANREQYKIISIVCYY